MKRILPLALLLAATSARAQAQSTIQGNTVQAGTTAPTTLYTGTIKAADVLTTDTPPTPLVLAGQSAWSQATTNPNGANLILTGGQGRRFYTVVTYASTGGKTCTVTTNGGTPQVYTEGTQFQCVSAGSNNACATNLAAAINANSTNNPYVTATAVAASVYLDLKQYGYSVTIATNAGAPLTATSGTDGNASLAGLLSITSTGDLTLGWGNANALVLPSDAAHGYSAVIQTANSLYIKLGSSSYQFSVSGFMPPTTTVDSGNSSFPWRSMSVSAAIYGTTTGKTLTDGSATIFAKVGVASGSTWGGNILFKIEGKDATDWTILEGDVHVAAINKAGTITCTVGTPNVTTSLTTGGATQTLTGFTCSDAGANVLNILCNYTDSLTDSSNWPKIFHRADTVNDIGSVYTPQ